MTNKSSKSKQREPTHAGDGNYRLFMKFKLNEALDTILDNVPEAIMAVLCIGFILCIVCLMVRECYEILVGK